MRLQFTKTEYICHSLKFDGPKFLDNGTLSDCHTLTVLYIAQCLDSKIGNSVKKVTENRSAIIGKFTLC